MTTAVLLTLPLPEAQLDAVHRITMMRGQPLWPRFLPTRWVVNLATVGPVGRVRHGPGTAGSVAGLLYFTVFFAPLPAAHSWWLTLVMSLPMLYLAVAIDRKSVV